MNFTSSNFATQHKTNHFQAVLSRYYSLINPWLKRQIGSTRSPSSIISSKRDNIGCGLTSPLKGGAKHIS